MVGRYQKKYKIVKETTGENSGETVLKTENGRYWSNEGEQYTGRINSGDQLGRRTDTGERYTSSFN